MDEHVEELTFVWLQSLPNSTTSDELLPLNHFQEIISDIRIFNDPDECISDILSISHEIILIWLGQGRSYLVDTLSTIDQVQYIYLSEPYELVLTYKVRGVVSNWDEMLYQLKRDVRICENRYTHLTACEANILRLESTTQDLTKHEAEFMWSQMLLEMIMKIPSPPNNVYIDLVDEARRFYRTNTTQLAVIDEFERNYRPNEAIRWYTRDSFLFKILNKALRTRNIIIIFKFRFFIQDICKQLLEIQRSQSPLTDVQVLYRGQFVSPEELAQLKRSVGALVSMNTFISTTKNRDVAMFFANTGPRHPLFASVFFEYVVEPSLSMADTVPFTDISNYSSIQSENEVLLSIGTVAEILSVSPINGNTDFHCIRLRLCRPNDSFLRGFQKFLLTHMQRRNLPESDYVFQLANLLYIMGEFTKSQQLLRLFSKNTDADLGAIQSFLMAASRFHEHIFECDDIDFTGRTEVKKFLDAWQTVANNPQLSSGEQTILNMTYKLITNLKSPWEEQDTSSNRSSILGQSGQIIKQIESLNTIVSSIIPSHPMMVRATQLSGEHQSMLGNHTDALEHFERAYKMSDSMLGENHPLRPLLLFEMAESAEKQGDDDKAIKLLQQSIVDPNKSSSIHIHTLNALAGLYEKRKDWASAITCYRDITYLSNLPPNSYELVEAYISIGMTFIQMENISEATSNWQHALDLLRQHHPLEHSWPANLRDRIEIIRNLFSSLGLPV